MPLLVDREVQAVVDEFDFVDFAEYLESDDSFQKNTRAVRANGDDNLQILLAHANRFDAIALEFPILRDGRAFSIARELRVNGFEGQIRAVGETSRDKLSFLERCGFNAVELDDAAFKREHLEAYTEISVKYQAAVDQPYPIYRQTGVTA